MIRRLPTNRTDVNIDRKQVRCPNASTLGYGEYNARFSDFVTFSEDNAVKFGRIAGRVTITSALEYGKVYLLVITIGQDHSHAFERFVEPADILTITRPANFDANALTYLLSADFASHSTEVYRQTYSEGWSTPVKYLEWKDKQAQERKEYDKRHENCTTSPCEFHLKFAGILQNA